MYEDFLRESNIEVRETDGRGQSLFTTVGIPLNATIFEDSPLISFLLPAREFIDFGYCMNCLAPLNCGQTVRCDSCEFVYCSEACRSHHFLSHFGLCAGLNKESRAHIAEMHTEKSTLSGYAIAEVLCSICAKIAIKMLEGTSFEQAYEAVLAPYLFLAHSSQITLDFPLKTQFKYTQLVLRRAGGLLGFVDDVSFIFNALLDLDFYKCIASIIALNGSSVIIGDELVGIAVYSVASKINHSCVPNCFLTWATNNVVAVKAETEIAAGQEFSICYCQDGLPYERRKAILEEGWGFTCRCELCEQQRPKDDCM